MIDCFSTNRYFYKSNVTILSFIDIRIVLFRNDLSHILFYAVTMIVYCPPGSRSSDEIDDYGICHSCQF